MSSVNVCCLIGSAVQSASKGYFHCDCQILDCYWICGDDDGDDGAQESKV